MACIILEVYTTYKKRSVSEPSNQTVHEGRKPDRAQKDQIFISKEDSAGHNAWIRLWRATPLVACAMRSKDDRDGTHSACQFFHRIHPCERERPEEWEPAARGKSECHHALAIRPFSRSWRMPYAFEETRIEHTALLRDHCWRTGKVENRSEHDVSGPGGVRLDTDMARSCERNCERPGLTFVVVQQGWCSFWELV